MSISNMRPAGPGVVQQHYANRHAVRPPASFSIWHTCTPGSTSNKCACGQGEGGGAAQSRTADRQPWTHAAGANAADRCHKAESELALDAGMHHVPSPATACCGWRPPAPSALTCTGSLRCGCRLAVEGTCSCACTCSRQRQVKAGIDFAAHAPQPKRSRTQ